MLKDFRNSVKISGIYFFSALNLIFALPFYTKLIYQFIRTYLCICAYMYVLDVDNLKQFFCCDFFFFLYDVGLFKWQK